MGLGDATSIRTLEIHWPASESTQTFHDVALDQIVKIREGDSAIAPVKVKRLNLLSGTGVVPVHQHHVEIKP
jgi:hypothetical protein